MCTWGEGEGGSGKGGCEKGGRGGGGKGGRGKGKRGCYVGVGVRMGGGVKSKVREKKFDCSEMPPFRSIIIMHFLFTIRS